MATCDGDGDTIDDATYSNVIVKTSERMSHLHKLCLNRYGRITHYEPHFLANIFQRLHHIKELEIDRIAIGKEINFIWTVDQEE